MISAFFVRWLLPTGSVAPCLFQLMTGRGSPVALQFNVKVPPIIAKLFPGGVMVNTGSEITTSWVFLSTFPKRLTAEQKYVSESTLRTSEICKALLLYFALPWGNWPVDFLQVTPGAGYPVTWQVGRVTLLPSVTYVGPGWRETRGWTATKWKTREFTNWFLGK